MWRAVVMGLVVVAGCGGEDRGGTGGGGQRGGTPRIAVPDAGTQRGHGAEPLRVRVPAADRTPPEAVLRLGDAEAVSGGRPPAPVRLTAPVVRPTAVGRDKQGMARIRVSVNARIACGDDVVPLVAYVPPPAIARTLIAPGTLARTELSRTVAVDLAAGRCPAADVTAIEGQLWADATSAGETEASSAPIRFLYRRSGMLDP